MVPSSEMVVAGVRFPYMGLREERLGEMEYLYPEKGTMESMLWV